MIDAHSFDKHPIFNGKNMIGLGNYSLRNPLCLIANGDNNFLSYGIAENSLLIVDPEQPFEDGKLSALRKINPVAGEPLFKLSVSLIGGYEYAGRVFLTINQYE